MKTKETRTTNDIDKTSAAIRSTPQARMEEIVEQMLADAVGSLMAIQLVIATRGKGGN
jgi:hypothetical protein